MSLDAKSLYSNQSRPVHDSEKGFEASLENTNHHDQKHHCEHGQTNTTTICRNIRLKRLLLPTLLALVVLCGLILAWRSVNWYGMSGWGFRVDNLVGRDTTTIGGITFPISLPACQYLSHDHSYI